MGYASRETVFEDMQREIRDLNISKGWRNADGTHRNSFGELVALIHEEVSEMLSAFRSHQLEDATEVVYGKLLPKPEGVGSEAADTLIRLLDLCEVHGIDIVAEYRRKMAYNQTRPFRHGGKVL